MQFIRQLLILFERGERWKLGLLAVALIVRAGAEMVGVASIMPFMSVLADPTLVEHNRWLAAIYDGFGFTSTTSFLTALGLTVVGFLALANTFSAATLYGMLRFSWGMHHRLSVRLLKGYLGQPYTFFLARNSAGLHKTILSEVKDVVKGLLTPALNVLARTLVVAALVGLLVALDPALAVVIVFVLGGAYAAIYFVVREKQRRLGRSRVDSNELRFKVAAEALGAIKDVKVFEREREFIEQFKPASLEYSKVTASNAVMAQLPRYPLETVGFGGIVLIALYYLHAGEGLAQIIPVITLYAFAGYRLMPELQQLFAGLAQIRFNRAALDDLTDDLRRANGTRLPKGRPELAFEHEISIENGTFRYPDSSAPALNSISLTIPRNASIGFVGASGSGKTTLVDVLLGLYELDQGCIKVDGRALDRETLRGWRRRVGYVPQRIFLTDDSIARNIGFGVPEDEIDYDRVRKAAEIASLDEFVGSLPDGYETVVGERGVRLSGGQSQRIGIARALYHEPDVLVMDEATSALDNLTENGVMESIRHLAGQKTIILIAHRLSTVRDCDHIFLMEDGRIVGQGSYDELAATNDSFRRLTQLEPQALPDSAPLLAPA